MDEQLNYFQFKMNISLKYYELLSRQFYSLLMEKLYMAVYVIVSWLSINLETNWITAFLRILQHAVYGTAFKAIWKLHLTQNTMRSFFGWNEHIIQEFQALLWLPFGFWIQTKSFSKSFYDLALV